MDLEKAGDRVPREELWYCVKKDVRVVQGVQQVYRQVQGEDRITPAIC